MVNASAHLLATKEDDADSESREEDASIDSCVRDVGQKWWNRQSARRKAKPTAAAIDPFWVKYTSGLAKEQYVKVGALDPTMWNKVAVKVRLISILTAMYPPVSALPRASRSPSSTPGHIHRLTRFPATTGCRTSSPTCPTWEEGCQKLTLKSEACSR